MEDTCRILLNLRNHAMTRIGRPLAQLRWERILRIVLAMLVATSSPVTAWAEIITLNSGLQITGQLDRLPSMNINPNTPFKPEGNVAVSKIIRLDDSLRRTYISSNNIRADGLAAEPGGLSQEKIKIDKRVASVGRAVVSVGPILNVGPWDEFGNRVFSMQTPRGPIDVIQGITEVTPVYTKVEGLQVEDAYMWDMRVATSSIPRDVLSRVLRRQIDDKDSRSRLQLVTLYIQAKRYRDALVELDEILQDFPKLTKLQDQRKSLYQLVAQDVIREIEYRRDSGQHQSAYNFLKNFPSKDVAGELLIKVRDMLDEYDRIYSQGQKILSLLEAHLEELKDHKAREVLVAIHDEIKNELNIHTLDRMADYLRLADDDKLKTDQKVSLAISGWLMGNGAGTENLAEATSLVTVRDLIREYLSTSLESDRTRLLSRLTEQEGFNPTNIARLLSHMKPPKATEPQEGMAVGTLRLQVPGLHPDESFEYLVQLPLEYDPYRRYPCVVSLHGAGSGPEDQILWWAGGANPQTGIRNGQAIRHGYIVIAPAWAKKTQRKYEYTAREHAAVLSCLRDALQRFSVDTDRVFLSGHSMGGDAAWDIALAHPDLWAGLLPVTATADKYVSLYWKNAKGLPMYFVAGERDGNRIADNARDLDRYMKRAGFDCMYVEYLGRGHEHFHDEIQRMFDWMGRQRREFFPKEIETTSVRPWDNFFWWIELDGFPERSYVLPINWPESRVRPSENEGRVLGNNSILVRSAANLATIWLSPELVNFDQPIEVNRRRVDVVPSSEVLLEDARTRGDRLHPFWARVDIVLGRR